MNENNSIPLYPNIKRYTTICKFTYTILELKLFQSVRIAVYLYNEHDVLVDSTQFLIENEEYSNWGSNDQYIVNLIKQKIQA